MYKASFMCTERERDRQTDRQTETETDKERQRETETEREEKTLLYRVLEPVSVLCQALN